MDGQADLEKRILRRLDPSGELAVLIRIYGSHFGRHTLMLLGRIAGIDITPFTTALDQARQIQQETAATILLFAPLGWAPTGRSNVETYRDALSIYEETNSLDKANQRLVDDWNEPETLRFAIMPLEAIAAGHDKLGEIFRFRARLIEKALAHHKAGAYDASVPIVLAQIDGIVQDLGVKGSLFENSDVGLSHFLDETSLFGLPESLRPLRKLFGASMRSSGISGKLSRHGILHGRELGYDTMENSTKVFVLLTAVIEWALPRGRALAEANRLVREAQYAGSDEVDSTGRRLDCREFADAKICLGYLTAFQLSEWKKSGRYRDDLESMFPGDRMVCDRSKLHVRITAKGNTYWAWRDTPSGFCFGVAESGGIPSPWHYAGMGAPVAGPGVDPRWRHVVSDPHHPDW